MGGIKSSGKMRYFQIRILPEQGKHLPGHLITKYFTKLEMINGTGVVDSLPSCIVKVEHEGLDLVQIGEDLRESLIIDKVLLEGEGFAYLRVKTPGPIQQIIAAEDEAWIMPPTSLSRENGFFMTIHGTPDGLKRVKDKLEVLVPKKMDMRISKMIIADWMSAPNLPERRTVVVQTAVDMGYYSVPRRCNQNDIADVLGLKQGTVAEHLQHAESVIINSWSDHMVLSESIEGN